MPKNPIIAISQAKVSNTPASHELMMKVGPKVCITTASHPGFLGFEQLIKTRILAMAGRYGGGSVDMGETLNPVALYQYTVWKDVAAHEHMHHDNFSTLFELCSRCLEMVIEGPWEVYYEVIKSDLPPLVGMTDVPSLLGAAVAAQQPLPKIALAQQRTVVVDDHWVMTGHEDAFERGVVETLKWMKSSVPGLFGWMVLKQIGASAIGSMQYDPEGLLKASLGSDPPQYNTNYGSAVPTEPPIPPQTPHNTWCTWNGRLPKWGTWAWATSWSSMNCACCITKGVLRHLDKGPYYLFFAPIMEQGLWRNKLVS